MNIAKQAIGITHRLGHQQNPLPCYSPFLEYKNNLSIRTLIFFNHGLRFNN
jgi:hypothetical protein